MNGYRVTEAAEAQAIGLCWLARSTGLPEIHSLRVAVVQLHPEPCAWCDWLLPDLMMLLEQREVSDWSEHQWWGMPGKARLRALALAAGRENAA